MSHNGDLECVVHPDLAASLQRLKDEWEGVSRIKEAPPIGMQRALLPGNRKQRRAALAQMRQLNKRDSNARDAT